MKLHNKCLIIYLLALFSVFLLLLFFLSIPRIYDFFYGDKIINQHIKEVIGNKTNHEEIASALMTWVHDNVVYPKQEDNITFLGLNLGFYNVGNKTVIFFRDVPASWTIKYRIGRCGEDAQYFMEVMNKLGYKSRRIKPIGWDHSWVEYYANENIKVILDPSSNQIIFDKQKWVEGKNVTKIEAIDSKGIKEDITSEYLNNTEEA